MSAYATFYSILSELRQALETRKSVSKDAEEIRVVAYRLILEEDFEILGEWRAEYLIVAHTLDEEDTIKRIDAQVTTIAKQRAQSGVILSIRSITSLDDTDTTSKRKSIVIECEVRWQV